MAHGLGTAEDSGVVRVLEEGVSGRQCVVGKAQFQGPHMRVFSNKLLQKYTNPTPYDVFPLLSAHNLSDSNFPEPAVCPRCPCNLSGRVSTMPARSWAATGPPPPEGANVDYAPRPRLTKMSPYQREKAARKYYQLCAILLCLLFLLCFAVPTQAAGPDLFSYQIQFPPTPTSVADAATSLDERATRILGSLACGSEVDYAGHQTKAGEDSTAFLIAKFEWVTGHPDLQGNRHLKLNGQPVVAGSPCTFTRYFQPPELCSFVETEQQCTDGSNLKGPDAAA